MEKKTSPLALLVFLVIAGILAMLVYDKIIEPLVDAAWSRWNSQPYDRNANVVGDAVANSVIDPEDQPQTQAGGDDEEIVILNQE